MISTPFIVLTVLFILSLFAVGTAFYVYRKLQQKKSAGPVPVMKPDFRHNELFERLQEYLLTDRNFAKAEVDTNLLISELATNRTYLFEAVKLATGKTLQEYMNSLRLEEAKRLLETTNELNENIAAVCGYNSVRTFYRLFRTYYNMSPTTYRKMVKRQKGNFERFGL